MRGGRKWLLPATISVTFKPPNMRFCVLVIFLLLFGSSSLSVAQNVDFIPRNFPGKEAELSVIQQQLSKADSLFYKPSKGNAAEALRLYLEIGRFNPNNTFLKYKTGACFLWSTRKGEAKSWLSQAYAEDPGISSDICYLLGQSYHYHAQWDSALYFYRLFEERYLNDHIANLSQRGAVQLKEDLNRWKQWAMHGEELSERPLNAVITNAGPVLNSPDPDYNPKLNAEGNQLAFTSRRASTTGGMKHVLDDKYYEDIYFSEIENQEWIPPLNPGSPLNTPLNDGLVSIALDGQSVILDYGGISGDLYESKLNGSRWTKPNAFPQEINSPEIESSACWSPDGKILYFSSDRRGGMGGADIWIAERKEDGGFREPYNPGPPLNSAFNEEYLFMHADGKTLYFSSDGPASIGGYDVFCSRFRDSTWSEPVNLGVPVNTPDDDIYFSLSPDGKTAWYSSERMEGYGGQDLYRIDFQEQELKPQALHLVNGRVMDAVSLQPLAAEIEVNDPGSNKRLLTTHSNARDGSFSIALPAGKRYGLVFTADAYLFHTENLDLGDLTTYHDGRKHIFLYRIEKNARPEKPVSVAVRKFCFDIQCDTTAGLWLDPATGTIGADFQGSVKQDVAKVIVRNREKITRFIEGGILMEDVVDLLCHEYVKQVAGSEQHIETGRHTGIWQMIRSELIVYRKLQEINPSDSLYYEVPYRIQNRKSGPFVINLTAIVCDALNDTTAQLELSVNLTQAVLNNFIRIALDNRPEIRRLKNSGWSARKIREQLAFEIARCGGYKRDISLSLQSRQLQDLVTQALVSVMPDLFMQSVFFSRNPLNQGETASPALMVQNRRDIVRDLIGSGKTLDEVSDLVWQEFNNQSGVTPVPSVKDSIRKSVKSEFLEIIAKDYLNPTQADETGNHLRSLLQSGLSYTDLKTCVSRAGNNRVTSSSGTASGVLLPPVAELIPDRRLFHLNLFETSREAVSDRDGGVDSAKLAVFRMDLRRITDEKSAVLKSLCRAGFSTEELTRILGEEIALQGGAMDEKGNAILHPGLKEMLYPMLKKHTAGADTGSIFSIHLNDAQQQSLCTWNRRITSVSEVPVFLQQSIRDQNEILGLLIKLLKNEDQVKRMFMRQIIRNCQPFQGDSMLLLHCISLGFEGFYNENLLTPPRYESKIVLNNIFFETNMADLALNSRVELQRLIDILNRYPNIRVEISGHTDNIGSEQYNMELSLRRARSVEAYLLSKGIRPERLQARGYGKTRPVAPNELEDGTDYPEGRQMNRRTEFLILDDEK